MAGEAERVGITGEHVIKPGSARSQSLPTSHAFSGGIALCPIILVHLSLFKRLIPCHMFMITVH